MNVVHGIEGLRQLPHGLVLSVGNYDGIHLGHQHILRAMRHLHDERNGAGLAVVTFEPHPLTVLRPEVAPPRLTPSALKQQLLADAGVDHLAILAPTKEVLNLTAEDFWKILRDEVRPVAMVEGGSFNFGKGRGGNIEKLREWAADSPIDLRVAEAVTVPLTDLWIVPVSSSLIRWLLGHGRARDAAICLGHPYTLVGKIVQGYQRGKSIGVPTANLDCDDQMVPLDGVYAGRCTVDGALYPAAVSIGTMPTFGNNRRQIEAHLIGFDGDLYGRTLHLELIDWLREQRKYPSVEQLQVQLRRDIEQVRDRATQDPSCPLVAV